MTESYILAIGATNVDIKGYAHAQLVLGTSNQGTIRNNPGGVARNIAENLARLGENVTLLSAVGDDGPGRRIKIRLEEAGVDLSYIVSSTDYHTSSYMALYDENKSLLYSIDETDVLELITSQYVYYNRSLVRDAEMVVMDSNLALETIASLIRQTNYYGVPVIADPTSATLAAKLLPYLPDLYMITPNAAEAEVLSGLSVTSSQTAMDAAHKLVSQGVEIAIVTLAERGVVYATSDTSGHIPALTTEIVDLTGASDAMTATIIFSLLHDIPLDEAVRLGASAAALTIRSEDSVVETLTLDKLYDL